MPKLGPVFLLGGLGLTVLAIQKSKAQEGKFIDLDPDEVPAHKSDQVAFSGNFENYKIGSSWRTKVLDQYLDDARKAGELAYEDYKQQPKNVPHPWLEEMVDKFGHDWDKPSGRTMAADTYFNSLLAQTRAEVLTRFKESHYAAIPGGAIALSELPLTSATEEFNGMISEYALAFQKREFGDQ